MKESQLDITVIIPTFNRSDALRQTLDALSANDYPTDRWEAIVIDDASTEDMSGVVQRIERGGFQGRYIRQTKNAGPAAARNLGASEAGGEYLIFIDNDIIAQPDFIRAHIETLQANPGCWVLGRIVHTPLMRSTPFGRYRDSVWEAFHKEHGNAGISQTTGISAANISLPAKDFKALGGFDEDFTIASSEDWELGMRARQNGVRVLYNPGIVVVHNDWAVSLVRFCERQKLYSVSDVLLWRKYGEASPRARLVRENAPVSWSEDSPRLILKKGCKLLLSCSPGRALLMFFCWLTERLVADTRLNRKAYEAAVAISIFRGVREGLRRYRSSEQTDGNAIRLKEA